MQRIRSSHFPPRGSRRTLAHNIHPIAQERRVTHLVSRQHHEAMFLTMCRIREFEEAAGRAYAAGLMAGSCHQYIGEEGIATGVCANLRDGDYIASYHRGHGHAIAKGVALEKMAMELLGRAGGACGGKGGSMHLFDYGKGMLGANGVIPDGVTMAVGAAQSIRLLGLDSVVVPFFGDGALNRGPLFEAFNWAKVYDLAVLFVCEDNEWSYTQRTRDVTAGPGAVERAAAFGLVTASVDGNNVLAVDRVTRELLASIRSGHGPALLHARAHRLRGHLHRDPARYRPAQELERALEQDCLKLARASLAGMGFTHQEIDAVHARAHAQVEQAFAIAREAPFPEAAMAFADVQDTGAPA